MPPAPALRPHPQAPMTSVELAAELAALPDLTAEQLRGRWLRLNGGPVPQLRAGMLRMALAWELQASIYGGLSKLARQRLDQLDTSKLVTTSPEVRPGMKLVREWNGVLYKVSVDDDGNVHWDGREWKSLSAVARAITGTRWSGPLFFGLRQQRRPA